MRFLVLLCLAFPIFATAARPSTATQSQNKRKKGASAKAEFSFPAIEGCPKDKREWLRKAPGIFLEKAQKQHLPIEIPDLAPKLGKKGSGVSASAVPFRGIGAPMIMVQAHDESSQLHLSGVLKCDPLKHRPALVSLTYVKGEQSGLAKIIEE
jgi:hypothetical protein